MTAEREPSIIHGQPVYGLDVDAWTRCRHYHGPTDVIALRFKCCGRWYPCFECHAACADHPATIWAAEEFDARAVLCGACGHLLTVAEYLQCDAVCPRCGTGFNPGCARHHHLYFEKAAP